MQIQVIPMESWVGIVIESREEGLQTGRMYQLKFASAYDKPNFRSMPSMKAWITLM